jgi:hypothetical protein
LSVPLAAAVNVADADVRACRKLESGHAAYAESRSRRRNYLASIGNAALAMGLRHSFLELEAVRKAVGEDANSAVAQINQNLIEKKVGLTISYAFNGVNDFPTDRWPGAPRNFFEVRQIPQCFLWWDHPQWVADKIAITPEVQTQFRTANQFHFFKSQAHAEELTRILGWPNCHELPCGFDPKVIAPIAVAPPADFDVVAIYFMRDEKLPADRSSHF